MLLSIIIRDLNININNINEYINFEIYFLNKNNKNIILIKREFYIVDNLIIIIFIHIDILHFEDIVFDIIKDIIIVSSYKKFEILIIFNI